ncbi:MAG: peroxiredoxin [Halobacteriaceae archaeon]
MLDIGDPVPRFDLPDHDGDRVTSEALAGDRYVLYFYPEAATRGCTIEARSFRDAWDRFEDRDLPVYGVSLDPVEKIAAFRRDEELPFTLLSDPDGTTAKAFGVYTERDHEGETIEIAERHTFVVGPDGTIERVYTDVSPADHAEEILADLE